MNSTTPAPLGADAPTPTRPSTQAVPNSPGPARAAWRPTLRGLLLDTAYTATALPLAVVAFAVTWIGVSAGVPLLIIWIGIPVLYLTVVLSSGIAAVERWRLRAWQGRPVVGPGYLTPAHGASWFSRLLLPLRDPQKWLDVLWGVVAIVPAVFAALVSLGLWSEVVGGLTYALWADAADQDWSFGPVVAGWLGLAPGSTGAVVVTALLAVLVLAVLPWLIRGAAWLQASFSDLLLNSRSDLSERARRADGARVAAQQAEAASLRRLERDIHDGPQQRLVRLTMDLGRAKRQITTDPELATATVEAALLQARETLEELRALSRGIAPPLLVDRGLGVALDELVVRSAVPVEITHELPAGLSPHVETAVYFTVSEALTNVAKHSGAAAAQARVVTEGDNLVVQVRDDGVGGAHLSKGRGLAGLEQRLTAVGGTFDVDSPAGGPTLLLARIPLS